MDLSPFGGPETSPRTAAALHPLIEAVDLSIGFPSETGMVTVVRGVSLAIPRGKTLGLVGESGCGNSMTGLALLNLIPPPGRILQGAVRFWPADGPPTDLASLPSRGSRIRAIRGAQISMVFQEPMSSLGPVLTIGQQIAEAIRAHERTGGREARERAIEMLRSVGVPAPEKRVDAHPHQLSGGLRQRAMIAMALACGPQLLIADEPTTALDVTVQAQILDLLQELQQSLGMAILLISHDLGVAAQLADEVVVMYSGKVVERGAAEAVFYEPQHPYTRGLLRAAPALGAPSRDRLYSIPGTVPSPAALPHGCAYRPRCAERIELCLQEPALLSVAPNHGTACWARFDLSSTQHTVVDA